MIPRANIAAWRKHVLWGLDEQVEQDLILSRILVEIFSDGFLKKELAFRGGTALNKLFFKPAVRYSEDIDLVRTSTGPIGKIVSNIRNKLDVWLGMPAVKRNHGRFTLYYSFEASVMLQPRVRIKIEINTRETDNALPLQFKSFSVKNFWFDGHAMVTTYAIEELLGTKLRALFQRKKGRDLFDLSTALEKLPDFSIAQVIQSFEHYLTFQDLRITRAIFEKNLYSKLHDPIFLNDLQPLLPVDLFYDIFHAARLVYDNYIKRLAGKPWKEVNKLELVLQNTF